MAAEDRIRWDGVFRRSSNKPYPPPDPLLLQFTPLPAPPVEAPPRALDLAGGLGQNGLWLAAQGYTTDIMDISRVALRRALMEMTARNLRNVNLLQVDVDEIQLEAGAYEVVCVFRYLKRNLFPLLKKATQPGGRIIYSTFNLAYLEHVPDFNRNFLLDPQELVSYFMDWQILHHEEVGHVSNIVAIKPDF